MCYLVACSVAESMLQHHRACSKPFMMQVHLDCTTQYGYLPIGHSHFLGQLCIIQLYACMLPHGVLANAGTPMAMAQSALGFGLFSFVMDYWQSTQPQPANAQMVCDGRQCHRASSRRRQVTLFMHLSTFLIDMMNVVHCMEWFDIYRAHSSCTCCMNRRA